MSTDLTEIHEAEFDDDDERNIEPRPTGTPMSGKTMFVLYYGTEDGSREDCSIFYTESELFEVEQDAKERQDELATLNKYVEGYYTELQSIDVI